MTNEKNNLGGRWFIAALLMASVPFAFAQQNENTVACDEGNEPIAIAYGDSTTGCAVSPATDTDRFLFSGTAGHLVELTIRSSNTNMDPRAEVRDDLNNFVATDQCSNVGCTFSLRFVLPETRSYLIIVDDVGGNESGAYQLQLELILPPPPGPLLDYDTMVTEAISPTTDMDRYTLDMTAGTTIRLLARSANTNMDPTIELRDPTGALVFNGAADGAQCSGVGCVIDLPLIPTMSGIYNLIIYDGTRNETGSYQLRMWCVDGDCPNAPAALPLGFDDPRSDEVSPVLDSDFYTFTTTPGTRVGLTVRSSTSNMDPTVEIRDASGNLIINGPSDGAQCPNVGCTFSIEFDATSGGTYSLMIYDEGTNESGGYQIGLWCILGDCDNDGEDDRFDAPRLIYTESITDSISPPVDADPFTFYASVGTDIQLNGRSSSTNADPTVRIRDPAGNIVIDGATDGAQCSNVGCTFSVPYSPAVSGIHTMLVFDGGNNEAGGYQVGLWCLRGDCDSDADGIRDGDFATLNYGEGVADTISPQIDSDFFQFNGSVGDEIRFNVVSTSSNMDPTFVVRDPTGSVIVDGVVDGATCNNVGCSFSYTLNPAMDGRHTLMMFDNVINESGNFQLSLECVFSPGPDFTCDDLEPMACGDNCIAVANIAQIDTNEDGYGNVCDTDIDNNGVTNVEDLGLLRLAFFSTPLSANWNPDIDFNGDGVVNVGDLGILRSGFFEPPGPSCVAPNSP